jgi:hypothetical protein
MISSSSAPGSDFVEKFWRHVVAPEIGERWLIVLARGPGAVIRDAAAHSMLCRELANRRDIDKSFWRANSSAGKEALPYRKYVVVGRPRLIASTSIGWLLRPAERALWGEYQDEDDGRCGDTICYAGRDLSRHQIGVTAKGHRLFDVDHAIVALHICEIDGKDYEVVTIAGLGWLGTLGATWILCNPVLRRELRDQFDRLVGDLRGCRPDLAFELVIRISVPDRSHLEEILNLLERPVVAGDPSGRALSFELEIAMVAREDRKPATWMASSTARRLTLVPHARGGTASLDAWECDLSVQRFRLVQLLNGAEQGVPADALRAALGYADTPRGWKTFRTLVSDTRQWLDARTARGWAVRIICKNGVYRLHLPGEDA